MWGRLGHDELVYGFLKFLFVSRTYFVTAISIIINSIFPVYSILLDAQKKEYRQINLLLEREIHHFAKVPK